MKYKALICDVDGTIRPYLGYSRDNMPSARVIEAIKKASEKVTVCLASGRSLYLLNPVLEILDLNGYVVSNDGSVVYDVKSKEIIYDRPLTKLDFEYALSQMSDIRPLHISYPEGNIAYTDGLNITRTPYDLFTEEVLQKEIADEIVEKMKSIPTINCYSYPGHLDKNLYGVAVKHAEATKQHGVFEVLKALGIDRKEAIGVGDSYNDFSLLMACGLKVAMGNAIPELKDIADYIAPSVDEDGVVSVIEKYILNNP